MTLRVYRQFTEVNGKMVKTLSVSNQALREQGEWAMKDAGAIHDVARATVDMGTAMENVDGPTRTVGQLAGERRSVAPRSIVEKLMALPGSHDCRPGSRREEARRASVAEQDSRTRWSAVGPRSW